MHLLLCLVILGDVLIIFCFLLYWFEWMNQSINRIDWFIIIWRDSGCCLCKNRNYRRFSFRGIRDRHLCSKPGCWVPLDPRFRVVAVRYISVRSPPISYRRIGPSWWNNRRNFDCPGRNKSVRRRDKRKCRCHTSNSYRILDCWLGNSIPPWPHHCYLWPTLQYRPSFRRWAHRYLHAALQYCPSVRRWERMSERMSEWRYL